MDLVKQLRSQFNLDLSQVKNLSDLNQLEINYLGRQGKVNDLLKKIKDIPVAKKKLFGQEANQLKLFIIEEIKNKKNALLKNEDKNQQIDITLPGKQIPKGSLHILTLAIEEISQIFTKIGFIRVSYPEVEWEYFAFEALNMPKEHPARDDFETFFIDFPEDEKMGKMVLTPHTSSGQIREMKRVKIPPIRMINIAKTYRPNWDTTHAPMFSQFEGLCLDKNINITHLKGTIDYFAKEFFGADREIRLRPFHFQFTEPSFEVDVSCGICQGKGEINGKKCKVCKSGWLELGGAGMVHPNVLKAGGIDPQIYSGWAFGFGPERCFMMKKDVKIDDIRLLYEGNIRFLEQF